MHVEEGGLASIGIRLCSDNKQFQSVRGFIHQGFSSCSHYRFHASQKDMRMGGRPLPHSHSRFQAD